MTTSLLFICGFPSGGTDLTRSILNAHPDIYINGEMPLLKNIARHGYHHQDQFRTLDEVKSFQSLLGSLDVYKNIQNLEQDFQPILQRKTSLTLEEVLYTFFSARDRKIWGNKTPQNTENIELLAQLFPQAKFLVITRDVRDVCLSWRDKWGKDILLCADKWASRMQAGWEMSQALASGQVLWIKYEDLLTNLETVSRQICAFLGLDFSHRMLEYHLYVETIIDGKINYGQPIKQENQGKWLQRLSQRQILRIEQIAFSSMKLLGYHPQAAASHKPLSSTQKRLARLRDLQAMVLVGNRASGDNSLRKRIAALAYEIKKRQGV